MVSICLVIGFPVAYFLARTRSRWRGTLIFIVVSPLLISVVIRNLGWLPVLGSSGVVNWLLVSLHILKEPVQLINNYIGVVIGLTHALSPFMILSLMTVIQRIEPETEHVVESAYHRHLERGAGRQTGAQRHGRHNTPVEAADGVVRFPQCRGHAGGCRGRVGRLWAGRRQCRRGRPAARGHDALGAVRAGARLGRAA